MRCPKKKCRSPLFVRRYEFRLCRKDYGSYYKYVNFPRYMFDHYVLYKSFKSYGNDVFPLSSKFPGPPPVLPRTHDEEIRITEYEEREYKLARGRVDDIFVDLSKIQMYMPPSKTMLLSKIPQRAPLRRVQSMSELYRPEIELKPNAKLASHKANVDSYDVLSKKFGGCTLSDTAWNHMEKTSSGHAAALLPRRSLSVIELDKMCKEFECTLNFEQDRTSAVSELVEPDWRSIYSCLSESC